MIEHKRNLTIQMRTVSQSNKKLRPVSIGALPLENGYENVFANVIKVVCYLYLVRHA